MKVPRSLDLKKRISKTNSDPEHEITYISLEKKKRDVKFYGVSRETQNLPSNIGLFVKLIYIKFEEVLIKKSDKTSIVVSTSTIASTSIL